MPKVACNMGALAPFLRLTYREDVVFLLGASIVSSLPLFPRPSQHDRVSLVPSDPFVAPVHLIPHATHVARARTSTRPFPPLLPTRHCMWPRSSHPIRPISLHLFLFLFISHHPFASFPLPRHLPRSICTSSSSPSLPTIHLHLFLSIVTSHAPCAPLPLPLHHLHALHAFPSLATLQLRLAMASS